MRKLFVVILISMLSLSCQNIEKPEKPENLIDREVFVDILVDTYLSNAVRSKAYQEIRNDNIRLEKYVYQKYAIDSLQFAQSNSYYSAAIDDYFKILQEVEEKLKALKVEGEEEEEVVENRKIKDLDPEDSDQ